MNRFSFLLALLVSALVLASPTRAQAPAFASIIEDLPLMEGLVEDMSAALQFDSAAGRIAEVTAVGPLSAGAVLGFYARTLPALGWRQMEPGRYRREAEELVIAISPNPAQPSSVSVHFRLSPGR